MSKKETIKFIVQMIASIATAIVTALGATSCVAAWDIDHSPLNIDHWPLNIEQKKSPGLLLTQGFRVLNKDGGFLLSRIALQYHRRRWA